MNPELAARNALHGDLQGAGGGKTEVTVEWSPLDGSTRVERKTFDEGRDSMKQGWTGTLEQFAAYLAKVKERAC